MFRRFILLSHPSNSGTEKRFLATKNLINNASIFIIHHFFRDWLQEFGDNHNLQKIGQATIEKTGGQPIHARQPIACFTVRVR
jgi:hypothetical protein